MEDRVKKLKEKGYFKVIDIDEKGFGTFRHPPKESKPLFNDYLNIAKSKKREADLKRTTDKSSSNRLYIESILNYIKGYRNEEQKIGREKSIGYYKGLYKYTSEIYKMIDSGSVYKKFVLRAMFAIKFHFIGMETKHQETELTKNIYELYNLYKINEDCTKIDDLEEAFYKIETGLENSTSRDQG